MLAADSNSKKLRSRSVIEGPERAPHRSMYKAMGLSDEDLSKPLIGVANTWNEVTPSSPFSNYGSTWDTCAYMKDSNGVVHLKGLVTGTHTGASTIFTLPSGYRPSKERMFPCISSASPDRALRVDIQADGDVIVDSTHSGWVSISNISFKI